jgi:hypothetical protein
MFKGMQTLDEFIDDMKRSDDNKANEKNAKIIVHPQNPQKSV